MDILIQGNTASVTKFIIEEYRKLSFVDNIVLSSYSNEINFDIPKYVTFVDNSILDNPGIGNRNLQINTTKNGLDKILSDECVKMRSDQFIRPDSMNMMRNYWLKNKKEDELVFVLGMYKVFPYHPRDHLFWGKTNSIKEIFNIPFDISYADTPDYTRCTRTETYIGQYYYAKQDNSIYEHINKPELFLFDNALKRDEALKKDFELRDRLFKPFPRISMMWLKYNLNEYHYNVGQSLSEYWAD